jgi:DedD protein
VRDLDRWKDKVELSLDGRQIFFLFFGSAVAACLIFVVGVLIGKRLEARALAMEPPPVEDPLAALDQLGDADDAAGLTYHKALTQHRAERAPASEKPAVAEKPASEKPASEKPASEKPASEKPAVAEKPASEKPAQPMAAPAKLPAAPPADDASDANAEAAMSLPKPPSIAVAAKPAAAPVAAKPLPPGKPQVVAQKTPPVGHFTLQLSAFPERAQADDFARKIQGAGYRPYVVASEIPGKGTFYRVRVGDYLTKEAASSAKSDFERKQHTIAYVAKL